MKSKFAKEVPLLLIALAPIIYLMFIWSELPDRVPMHFNLEGEVNRYGNKLELVFLSLFLPFLMYGIMWLVPIIDPKKKINEMGTKLHSMKFILTAFMSVLALIMIHTTRTGTMGTSGSYVVTALGGLFAILGNYFKAVRPNYFIGLRTPWTLENEEVWKITHRFTGWLWFVAGIGLMACGLVFDTSTSFKIFAGVTVLIVIVPTVYSYRVYKKMVGNKSQQSNDQSTRNE